MVKKAEQIRKVDYKALLQAVPIGEENSLPLRYFVSRFGYAYSTTSSALHNLIRAGKIKRRRLKVYLYWRESEEEKKLHEDKTAKGGNPMEREGRSGQLIKGEIKSREEYDMFAEAILSPELQKVSLKKLIEQGDDMSWYLRMMPELQIAFNAGYAKEWIERHLSDSFVIFDRLYQEVEGVETETEKETEAKHPQKHDLIALKEEVSKLEDRIAELEGESEYFRVSQKKQELEGRATALEKQLKKMQEEEWKVKEDILK
ncbi:hypothetical protein KAW18_15600 [candidate division WOR-3 bacterium]|nr:hypothetical protein [candidate division WOR-3 bacterium]